MVKYIYLLTFFFEGFNNWIVKKEEKDEDINTSYMNEYPHKRVKVRDLMKILEKSKVIVSKV